jgi:HTH-type transcriptional regulator/antitoxin HigA
MNIKPIKAKADYKCALAEVGGLMSARAGTPASDKLDVRVTLIEAYESRHYPISPPDPIEAIKFCIEQSGLTVKDLEPAIGRSNRVYEVLNGTRSLTLPMIWKLHDMFGIPAESLIRPTARARAA